MKFKLHMKIEMLKEQIMVATNRIEWDLNRKR